MIENIAYRYSGNKKLQVINIIEEGRYGGPQARIAKVAVGLKDMGIETTVICPVQDSNLLVSKLRTYHIPCVPIRMHRLTKQLTHLFQFILFFIPEVLSLRRHLLKNKCDVIHCNGSWQLKGMLATKLAASGAKVIYHLNDTDMVPIIKRLFSLMAKYWVDGFIPACQRSKDYYLKDNPLESKLNMVIQAPVNTTKFDPDKVLPDSKVAQLPGTKIVTVCNIDPNKGLDTFLDMCDALNKRYVDCGLSFIVVGSVYKSQEKYFAMLMNKVKQRNISNLHFWGASNNIQGILKACDIYVCASHNESSPMAIWEAMSMGKPVVSTDVGDVALYLGKGDYGFCVPVSDLNALTEKVSFLIEDSVTRQLMGSQARDFAIKNLDLKICVLKHAKFYRMIVS